MIRRARLKRARALFRAVLCPSCKLPELPATPEQTTALRTRSKTLKHPGMRISLTGSLVIGVLLFLGRQSLRSLALRSSQLQLLRELSPKACALNMGASRTLLGKV